MVTHHLLVILILIAHTVISPLRILLIKPLLLEVPMLHLIKLLVPVHLGIIEILITPHHKPLAQEVLPRGLSFLLSLRLGTPQVRIYSEAGGCRSDVLPRRRRFRCGGCLACWWCVAGERRGDSLQACLAAQER
ncbi:Coiled-coil domain-containing protein 97 [Cytospora mali]|uniref:Coiled-coil domain-containing protein 97 n=1 Tax=Cytospora mali TaxID=578113 RepID=A0A194UZD9_CYTMA|nr:Coiled-coil domain-containing protein 97 [Valsa mali var. pyri (nom. inval.)]